jgi:predicted glycosyltransferase involved in capsule biosynthesis
MVDVGIDVVLPISSINWLPYLRNSCRSIRNQKYPQDHIGIIVSYLYGSEEPLETMASLCRDFEALLVQKKRRQVEAFETPLARNAGARHAARDMVAFIDADLILHPDTFALAAPFLQQNNPVIIPVAESSHGPDWSLFQDQNEEGLRKEASESPCRHSAMGAVIVSSKAVREIHGYDEQMYGWGADDTDFMFRAIRHCGKVINLADRACPFAIHQQHPAPYRETNFTIRNRTIFASSETTVRNEREWGGIPLTAALLQEE